MCYGLLVCAHQRPSLWIYFQPSNGCFSCFGGDFVFRSKAVSGKVSIRALYLFQTESYKSLTYSLALQYIGSSANSAGAVCCALG